jgi:chorismate lyase / 3-hydroxybenzoate synthase
MSFLNFHPADSMPAVPRETAGILGGARLGGETTAVDWPEQAIFATLPGSTATMLREFWWVDEACQAGCTEGIVWRRAGDVLYGSIELDEQLFAGQDKPALQVASEEAYRRIFRLLDAQGLPVLWRVWNYLAGINAETDGLERYRQFNIGRQDAFLACRRGATGNVPAACALGLAGGPLSIAFLAGATPAIAVENPRQVSAYHYPAAYGPRSPTFSRAALVYPPGQEILFVSGTASIVGHQTVHPGDVAGQCEESLANIRAVLHEANAQRRSAEFVMDALVYRVYLRHAEDCPVVRNILQQTVGQAEVAYVQADICRADLLVEIEAQALHVLETGNAAVVASR